MKLAYRAFLLTLTIMALMLSVSAQTLRPEKDPRNIAPTVGTGGPVGGPTGLFTVYDGQTLRKGEWTFGVAYSNFDRDPGNVDLTEVPLNFQIGLNDYIELFFNTDAFRGIKVNQPRHLSSMYLPDAVFSNLPAIILAPNGLLNNQYAGQAIYRPIGNQPTVLYPYTGGSAGTFGYPGNQSGNPTLGPPTGGGEASLFPGVGSTYGSILPGVVLQTAAIPVGGNCPFPTSCTVPTVFTVAPSYLNDAPFIGQGYGESDFNTMSVGAKIRFTGPNNPVGVGLIPFYRFYTNNASSLSGFAELQQGASPGSKNGDIGLIAFGDARVRKWLNISANVGFIYNGDVEANGATLLDRGNELLAAFAVDFPVNKHFQPILEFRSQQFVGGRTPNAFENNPLDVIAGARVFPYRWMSLGAAYRYHANSQDRGSIEDSVFENFVTIPCTPGVGGAITGGNGCQPRVIRTSTEGRIPGFTPSTDPHGFIASFSIGRRNERAREILNKPATINSVDLSRTEVTKPCKPGFRPKEGETCSDDQTVNVRTSASDPEGDVLTYNYTVSGGRIVGQGANVSWDLSGVNPGEYTLTAAVDDGCGVCSDPMTKTVKVRDCDCEKECNCSELTVSGPAAVVQPGSTMTFTANVTGGDQQNLNFNWSVDKGSIVSGQGTQTITVGGTDALEGQTIRATVDMTSDCEVCKRSASDTGVVATKPKPVLIDEFGKLANNDLKARIDNLYINLQSDPTATGYIINYGPAREVARREKVIRDHIAFRSLDPDKVVLVNGGVEDTIRTRVWVVPAGADSSTINE
ncbi:MAG: hypothetical protein HKN33_15040 [Pyrinomonadaceae bacterium]|nr:hypothetical protein [Pyrinomonadaceae bacterium]